MVFLILLLNLLSDYMKKIVYGAFVFFAFLLTGCHRDYTYIDWMKHPKALQKAILQCQRNERPECVDVFKAAEDFLALIHQRSNDPEAFGLMLLQAEQKAAALENEIKEDQQKGALQEAVEKNQTLMKVKDQIKIGLAVVAMTSEE